MAVTTGKNGLKQSVTAASAMDIEDTSPKGGARISEKVVGGDIVDYIKWLGQHGEFLGNTRKHPSPRNPTYVGRIRYNCIMHRSRNGRGREEGKCPFMIHLLKFRTHDGWLVRRQGQHNHAPLSPSYRSQRYEWLLHSLQIERDDLEKQCASVFGDSRHKRATSARAPVPILPRLYFVPCQCLRFGPVCKCAHRATVAPALLQTTGSHGMMPGLSKRTGSVKISGQPQRKSNNK